MPAARPREPELTQRMGCFRRGLVLLFALGFVAAALVIGVPPSSMDWRRASRTTSTPACFSAVCCSCRG